MLFTIKMKEIERKSILGTKLGKTLKVFEIEAKNWIEAADQADKMFIASPEYDHNKEFFSYVV